MRPRTPVAIALSLTLGWVGHALTHPDLARADKTTAPPHATMEHLAKVLVQVENRYVDPVDRDKLLAGAIKGMVSELDPHSEFYTPKEYAEFLAETNGVFGGVGLEVDGRGEYLVVIAPIEAGPAEKAGVKAGDEIVAIDGDDAKGISIEKSIRRLRGKPGTKVELTIRRPSDGKVYKVPLVRAEIHSPSVRTALLPGNIGYIRLAQFQETTHTELLEAVTKLKAKAGGKLLGVVLDLRRNPGGLVKQAVLVADEFLDKGVIFSMRGQGGKLVEEAKASSGGVLVDAKLSVLVDDGCASAAELLAGALQDNKRATIVGTTTYGKGSVQSLIELPGGGGLKLTTARYYTPSGRAIQAQGVEPDLVVEGTRVADERPLPFLKEKDLPNALPPEAGKPLPSTAPSLDAKPKSKPAPIPREPDLEKDFPLRMAHQVVAAKLKGAPL